ncbi:5-oxoprolinase subunit PxpA [Vibrio aerogenes]|nr:5-oxoprolinase subunit PxpA [Vibrio aerogenes]
MKLNCDLGESYGSWVAGMDEAVMPFIDMANIACGFHASDPDVMAKTIQSAVKHGVTIGAHPGYDDKKGFGRRSIPHTSSEISNLVVYQVGAMMGMCRLYGATVEYVKPHGALYMDMMRDEAVYRAIIQGMAQAGFGVPLMILAKVDNSAYQAIADEAGVSLLFEAFADRAYTSEGSLTPRSLPGAVYHDPEQIIGQLKQLVMHGSVISIDGTELRMKADTVCVHGDNQESVQTVHLLRQVVDQ